MDPLFVGIGIGLLIVFTIGFLLIRRTILGFKEGMRDGKQ